MKKEFELMTGLPEGPITEMFGEHTQPESEVLPLPPSEEVAVPVQTVDVEIPELTMHVCDVCNEYEVHGVFASSVGPISFGYCYECASKGAEPYGTLVAYISSAYGVAEWDNPATQLHYHKSQLVYASLEVAKKSFADFVADVRSAIIRFDEEYNESMRKEELYHEVQEDTQRTFAYSELASVFSKPEDARLIEIVKGKYNDSMELLVDYTGSYHLFNRLDGDKYTYHNRVEFLPEGHPRLSE